jgi:hypothetical protein
MKEEEVKVIEYTIDDSGYLGVHAMSLVENPAIEVDFVALSKTRKVQQAAVEEGERKMVYGAVMLPEQLIYRVDAVGREYYCKYSKETINKIAQEYLKRNMHHNSNLEHEIPVAGCTVVESWITEGQFDKSQNFGFNFPEGTWCIGMKIDNDEVWASIKQGDVKGFSLEGFFTEISDEYMTQQEIEKIMKELENELTGM